MDFRKLFAFATLLTFALAIEWVVVEQDAPHRVGKLPQGWKKHEVETLQRHSSPIKLTIALTQQNVDKFEELFWKISDPHSMKFRRYLKFDQMVNMLAPSDSDIEEVTHWLNSYGISNIELHKSRDFLSFQTDIQTAERLLNTEFHVFHHASGRRFVKAVNSYSVPAEISNKIDFISGFRFPMVPRSHNFKQGGLPSRKLQQKILGKFPENLKDSNGPLLVYINPLDSLVSNVFLPLCFDGSVYTSNSQTVTTVCEDPSIESVIVNVTQNGYRPQTFTFPLNTINCQPCNQSQPGHFLTACNQSNVQFGLPDNTVYCEVVISHLHNYANTSFTFQSMYSDYSFSSAQLEPQQIVLSEYTTPQLLWDLYQIPAGTVSTSGSANMSVAEFLGQYYDPNDLSLFFQLTGLPDNSDLVTVIGPNNATVPGGEATLDIEYIMGVARNVPTVFWSLGQLHDGQEPFLDWITDVVNSEYPPWVHSISYGDDEDSLSESYMSRVNIEFMKAGTRGISLLFSSGDNGVFGGDSFECLSFTPSFPATSPYVTTVGATILSKQTIPMCFQEIYGLPVGCHQKGEVTSSTASGSRVTSGGGFSNVFSRPSYQNTFVSNYVQNSLGDIPDDFYKSTGRAYPDIAALGHNFLVVLGQTVVPIDGTSASAPVSAGIISLLNDVQFNYINPPLGFLNPWLYNLYSTNATAFNDVVLGDNSCSEVSWICCDYGYPAAVGWDAVTGLGSLHYEVLANILKGF